VSIVVAGWYEDDADTGEELVYTGEGVQGKQKGKGVQGKQKGTEAPLLVLLPALNPQGRRLAGLHAFLLGRPSLPTLPTLRAFIVCAQARAATTCWVAGCRSTTRSWRQATGRWWETSW
jgi:hypothetical protein